MKNLVDAILEDDANLDAFLGGKNVRLKAGKKNVMVNYSTGEVQLDKTILDKTTKSRINRKLSALTVNKWHDGIPMKEIEDILAEFHLVPLQEDYTRWSGFFTGRDGRADIMLAFNVHDAGEFYTPLKNSMLSMTWHKMDQSGRYEIVAYVG